MEAAGLTAQADSIRNVAATIAYDAMGYYKGNVSKNEVVSRHSPVELQYAEPDRTLATFRNRTTGGWLEPFGAPCWTTTTTPAIQHTMTSYSKLCWPR